MLEESCVRIYRTEKKLYNEPQEEAVPMSKKLELLAQRMNQLQELRRQRDTISQRIRTMEDMLPQLEQSVQDEQADVDRLESGGFTSFVYGIIDRQEQKLEKERQEADLARNQYQAALNTLQDLYRQQENLTESIGQMGDPQGEYQRLYEETRQRLLAGSSPDAQRLRQLEAEGRQLRSLGKELVEARNAGEQVMDKIDQIQRSLGSASTWGTVDLFSDSFFADLAKYSHMDSAQSQMQELNRLLQRFSKELRDVDTSVQLSADIGSGMRFADIFFDNIFTDAMALQRIDRVKSEVNRISGQVSRQLDEISNRQSYADQAIRQKSREAEQLILRAGDA